MNWQQLTALGIVLAVAALFIWRSADPERHKHGCNCGCEPEPDDENRGKKV